MLAAIAHRQLAGAPDALRDNYVAFYLLHRASLSTLMFIELAVRAVATRATGCPA